jgi:hypothetical protein
MRGVCGHDHALGPRTRSGLWAYEAKRWWWPLGWLDCELCLHRKPVGYVPLIIQWGTNATSDMLRRSARCTK